METAKEGEEGRNRSLKNVIRILYTNAQSIVNKLDELRTVVFEIKPEIIGINESWTNSNSDHSIPLLNIPGYSLICRKDRSDTTNGGTSVNFKAGFYPPEKTVCWLYPL